VHQRKRLTGVAATAFVHPKAEVSTDLVAGDYAFVAPYCKVDPGVEIGRYSMLARQVAIVGDDHEWTLPGTPIQFSGRPPQSRTVIGDDVWVGYGALVRRGVTIGRGAIVAAHAVVTKNVAPYTVVAGVPAIEIAQRFPNAPDRAKHDAMLDGPLVAPSFAAKLSGPR
jgi:acetyltransferase-like isoleucine patch superfamily enzyme